MQLTVHYSETDYFELLRFATRKARWLCATLRWTFAIYLVFFSLMMFTTFSRQATVSLIFNQIITDPLVLSCLIGEILLLPPLVNALLFRDSKLKNRNIIPFYNLTYQITLQGISAYDSNGQQVYAYAYSALTHVRRTNTMLMVFSGKVLLFSIPLRCFPSLASAIGLENKLLSSILIARSHASPLLQPAKGNSLWQFTYNYYEPLAAQSIPAARKATRKQLRTNILFWLCLFLVIPLAFVVMEKGFITLAPSLAAFIVGLLLLFCLCLIAVVLVNSSGNAKNIPSFRYGISTIEISDTGLRLFNNKADTFTPWHCLTTLASNKHGITILDGQNIICYIPYTAADFSIIAAAADFMEMQIHQAASNKPGTPAAARP